MARSLIILSSLLGILCAALVIARDAAASQEPLASSRPGTGEYVVYAGLGSDSPSTPTLEIFEAGNAAEVLSAEPVAPGSWSIVIYLDTAQSGETQIRRLARQLGDGLDALLALGTIEIVVADPDPRSLLLPTRDPARVGDALERMALRPESEDAVRARRRSFLSRLEEIQLRKARNETEGVDPGPPALAALRDEIAMRRAQQDGLLSFLAERGPATSPRALVLLSDPLALDPLDFYGPRVEDEAPLAGELVSLADAEEISEAAIALGWTLLAWAPNPGGGDDDDGGLKYRPTADTPVGFRLRFGGDRKPEETTPTEPDTLEVTPTSRRRREQLAADTGGLLLGGPDGAVAELSSLARRYRVHYRAPESSGALLPYPLEVSTTDRGPTIAPALTFHGQVPEAISAMRVRRGLDGEVTGESLGVVAKVSFDPRRVLTEPARLEARADPAVDSPLRITMAAALEDDSVVMRHEEIAPGVSRSEGTLFYTTDVRIPATTNATVVLVEELDTGAWGFAFADLIDATEPAVADADQQAQVTGEKAIRIYPEDPSAVRGRTTFAVEARDNVARVEYYLDGESVTERDRPPFRARIDLGRGAQFREVTAVAFDADGFELDRDSLLVNEPPEAFWVRIINPRPGKRVGPVGVEIDLKVPVDSEVERVDVYWGDQRTSSLYEEPWSASVRIPVDRPEGYIRVEARLVDGRTAEDVVLMNRPGFGTEIGVELVELFVVATDRSGSPVRDLPAESFTVLEDGVPQEIQTVAPAGDLQLTVGLTIDTSSSLFVRMPAVRRAARDFAKSLISNRDRAFLVEFGANAKLVQGVTSNLRSIVTGIDSLEPFGTTPVWEAVVLSLRQLQPVPGRKALVVFYDGDDEDEDFSFRQCLALARESAVPIYLIVVNNEAARSDGRSFKTRNFVDRLQSLAAAGGGKVHFVSTEQDLEPIFEAINQELRSHYMITYYPKSIAGGPQWRPVTVQVDRRGIEARTIEGYAQLRP